jgi:hypothetical protein
VWAGTRVQPQTGAPLPRCGMPLLRREAPRTAPRLLACDTEVPLPPHLSARSATHPASCSSLHAALAGADRGADQAVFRAGRECQRLRVHG